MLNLIKEVVSPNFEMISFKKMHPKTKDAKNHMLKLIIVMYENVAENTMFSHLIN